MPRRRIGLGLISRRPTPLHAGSCRARQSTAGRARVISATRPPLLGGILVLADAGNPDVNVAAIVNSVMKPRTCCRRIPQAATEISITLLFKHRSQQVVDGCEIVRQDQSARCCQQRVHLSGLSLRSIRQCFDGGEWSRLPMRSFKLQIVELQPLHSRRQDECIANV